ncbi:MAG: SusF/SusE family outer membrane protein [Prevotella sp.]|nr:SusF/SusE family outer membrane protein [Prevotella sp.]
MKKIHSYAMLLFAGAFAMMSCSDDNESNPTLVQPTQFVLNDIAEAGGIIDLQKSQSVVLSWSQPVPYTDMNSPVVPTYTVQLSSTGSFNTEFDTNEEDNTGADYISLDETYSNGQNVAITAESIDKALIQLNGWEEGQVPETLALSVRVKAAVRDASFNEYYPIYSNVIGLSIIPYYMELKPADPEIWWLIGGDICDGSWGGEYATNVIPMQTIEGAEYDKKSGAGEIQWIGYLAGNGFKLRGSMDDNWATQWGQGSAFGSYVKNDGGSGDIKVPEAGIYTVSLNTATDVLSITKYNGTPAVFNGMAISGTFNDWGDTEMAPCHTYAGAENHDWYITYTFAAGDKMKVKQLGSWDYNKGGVFVTYSNGLYAYGVDGGADLSVPEAGKYLILFNDITGYIRLIKQ